MKRLLPPVHMLLLATLLVCGLTYGPIHTYAADNSYTHTPSNGTQQYRIGFHFWKPGKIYDEAMAGIKDGLSLAGIDYEEVTLYSERKKSKAIENLRAMDRMGLDLIYSLSSAGTKIAQQIGMKTPVPSWHPRRWADDCSIRFFFRSLAERPASTRLRWTRARCPPPHTFSPAH